MNSSKIIIAGLTVTYLATKHSRELYNGYRALRVFKKRK